MEQLLKKFEAWVSFSLSLSLYPSMPQRKLGIGHGSSCCRRQHFTRPLRRTHTHTYAHLQSHPHPHPTIYIQIVLTLLCADFWPNIISGILRLIYFSICVGFKCDKRVWVLFLLFNQMSFKFNFNFKSLQRVL